MLQRLSKYSGHMWEKTRWELSGNTNSARFRPGAGIILQAYSVFVLSHVGGEIKEPPHRPAWQAAQQWRQHGKQHLCTSQWIDLFVLIAYWCYYTWQDNRLHMCLGGCIYTLLTSGLHLIRLQSVIPLKYITVKHFTCTHSDYLRRVTEKYPVLSSLVFYLESLQPGDWPHLKWRSCCCVSIRSPYWTTSAYKDFSLI